ncbi:MAG: thioredoxin family protein [Candidatus Riflebacteria bacterium]|nr:thioredoxin family protein [Candidatus Riflebacteria bacterium]
MKMKIEVFTAGCGFCEPVVEQARQIARQNCELLVRDVRSNPEALARATELGVQRVPAVAIDGRLAPCCSATWSVEEALREAGVGEPRCPRVVAKQQGREDVRTAGPKAIGSTPRP